jgi:hypothetical protein
MRGASQASLLLLLYPNLAIVTAQAGAERHGACRLDAYMDAEAKRRHLSRALPEPPSASGRDHLRALEPICRQVRSGLGAPEQRWHASRTGLQRGPRLGGDPIGPHPGSAVSLEPVDIESEVLRECPKIRELLMTLARKECPRERPERPLQARRFGRLRRTTCGHPA